MDFVSTTADVDFADIMNKKSFCSKRESIISNLSQLDIIDENGYLSCSSKTSDTYQNGSEIGSHSRSQGTSTSTTNNTSDGGKSDSCISDTSTISKQFSTLTLKTKSNNNNNPFSPNSMARKRLQAQKQTEKQKPHEKHTL